MNTKRKNTKGFTLVELIVVLVILAILIALLVPALTGYIDKANQKAAMTECRQVVVAAQTTASELYGKDEFSFAKMNELTDDILTLAETDGTIIDWDFSDPSTVDMLLYTTRKNVIVLYENKIYTIIDTETYMGSAKGLTYLAKKIDKTKDMNTTNTLKYPSQVLQDYMKQENGGKLPGLNSHEKAIYSKLGINEDVDKIVWKPIYTADNKIFLVADSKKAAETGAAQGQMIYYDGNYYVHNNGYGKYDHAYITDQGAVIDLSSPQWTKVSL